MNILCIIPARSGSKSIHNKNIRKINGKPLLAYSIEHAINSKYITRIIISTDSVKYGNIAKKYGAEFLFRRPKNISGDSSTDLEVFKHALNWLQENEGYEPNIIVHLRPTYPIRKSIDIDNMIELILNDSKIDSVRSIVKSSNTPYKMWFLNKNKEIKPILKSKIKDAYNQPRQKLPNTFIQNACIDIIRTSTILELNSMSGSVIYGYEMNHFWDIDDIEHLINVKKYFKKNG